MVIVAANSILTIIGSTLFLMYGWLRDVHTDTGFYNLMALIIVAIFTGLMSYFYLKDDTTRIGKFVNKNNYLVFLGISILVMVLCFINFNPRAAAAKTRDEAVVENINKIQSYVANGSISSFASSSKEVVSAGLGYGFDLKEAKKAGYEYKLISNTLSEKESLDTACYTGYIKDGYKAAESAGWCKKYTYTGAASFDVCANFESDYSAKKVDADDIYAVDYSYWNHGAGKKCFTQKVNTKDGDLDFLIEPTPTSDYINYENSYIDDGSEYDYNY